MTSAPLHLWLSRLRSTTARSLFGCSNLSPGVLSPVNSYGVHLNTLSWKADHPGKQTVEGRTQTLVAGGLREQKEEGQASRD